MALNTFILPNLHFVNQNCPCKSTPILKFSSPGQSRASAHSSQYRHLLPKMLLLVNYLNCTVLLVWKRVHRTIPCFAQGKLYCHENGGSQVNRDSLSSSTRSRYRREGKKGSCFRVCCILGFVLPLTAALHSEDFKYLLRERSPARKPVAGRENG